MEHWYFGYTESGYGTNGILLGDRLLSLAKTKDGKIEFREECDGYFFKEFSKEEAIKALKEAIEWIQTDNNPIQLTEKSRS